MGQSISQLWAPAKIRVALVGLPSAGKTAIVTKLLERVAPTSPTMLEVDSITLNGQCYDLFDYAGDERYRAAWRSFFAPLHAIVFVVDSTDRESMLEAKDELFRLLQAEILALEPVLILANKRDLPKAMSINEVIDSLGLHNELQKSQRCVRAHSCKT
ncbi:ADP-ribosylation factor family-domain-containing protein [Thelonectria olida]|uniref:ADP-ribosylation factor family-domain-containing protein n=1 Tax=Thelonectria olida TaxID=1576542 RepID=A0A9P8W141_9HYPO|nr:ADP-ribosylation factor family-domain-containing protein [Thelonectria olida]